MEIAVVHDNEMMATRVRQALGVAGWNCPSGHLVGLDRAETYLVRARPGLVIVVTGGDPSSVVAKLRRLATGPLIAVGPVSDPRLVLAVLRAGAVDFVDEDDIESDLPAAIERLDSSRDRPTAPGRFLAVLAPSGGSGASLIAVNLAVAMARAHGTSLLVDLKPRSGDLAAMLDLKPTHTLPDLCSVVERIDRTLMEGTLAKHASGVHLLASARSYALPTPASAEGLATVLELGVALFPRVIADVPSDLGDESIAALAEADAILIAIRLEFNALRNAKGMIDHLERHEIDPGRIVLVGNRRGQPREIPPATVEEALRRKFLATLPDDPKAALASLNNGTPVLIENPRSYLAKALAGLATSLDALPPIPAATRRRAARAF